MAHRRKTWREKFSNGREPEIAVLDRSFGGIPPGSPILVSTPAEVDSYVRELPPGSAITLQELRIRLAERHGASGSCPISTSIFLRIASEVALEELAEGKAPSAVCPFWRAVDPKSPLASKLSCGPEFVERMRRAEGIPPSRTG